MVLLMVGSPINLKAHACCARQDAVEPAAVPAWSALFITTIEHSRERVQIFCISLSGGILGT